MLLLKFGLALWATLWTGAAEESQHSMEPPATPREFFKQQGVLEDLAHVVIFDAGSTGTRAYIHAYGWEAVECFGRGAAKVYMPGWTKKVKPGLATIWQELRGSDESTKKLALEKYFAPLREFFDETLLPSQQKGTFIFLRATGGFRYLTPEDQTEALDYVYSELLTWEGQTRRKWIRVLTGDEEGAFSWMALNQLARRFFGQFEHIALHPRIKSAVPPDEFTPIGLSDNWRAEAAGTAGRARKRRVGIVEVGGASAQIAVEPPKKMARRLMDETDPWIQRQRDPVLSSLGDGYHMLHFCHENLILQIRSLDGYGRQAALQKFLQFAANSTKSRSSSTVEVPCLPADIRLPISDSNVIHEVGASQTDHSGQWAVGAKNPNPEQCRMTIQRFLKASHLDTLPFDLDPGYRIYATENFYYFNHYVNMANHSLFSTQDFWDAAKNICGARSAAEVREYLHVEAAEDKTESGCFGLVFLSELLKHAVHVQPDMPIKAVTAVKELETNFALGSLILELPLAMREHINGGHQVMQSQHGGVDEL